jgi:hypothetical protein
MFERQSLRDPTRSNDVETVTFSSYTKQQLLDFLRKPTNNERQIRLASIQAYNASGQYRRLILYHAFMPLWAYVAMPANYNPQKMDAETLRKTYYKATSFIENMNLKHELAKALAVAFRDGVFYGVAWTSNASWFLQRVNPDLCALTAIEDGTWLYSVDMSKIKQEDLTKYPDEFTDMWNAYRKTGVKLQEVPSSVSFCVKADETVTYPIPPFASALPAIYDLEDYRALAAVSAESSNYKLLAMEVPLNNDGELSIPEPLIQNFVAQLQAKLPPFVGAVATPMKLDAVSFEKSAAAYDTNEIERATRNFWYNSGISPLLFGDAANTSAAALNLSIRTDEQLVLAAMSQCERLVNRHLKQLTGAVKYRINILPVTIFNQEKMIGYYKEAATYGLPTKMAYAAAVGIPSVGTEGLAALENDALNLKDKFVPLSSSHTQSADSGRPAKSDDDITETGEQTREDDEDANKA